MTATEPISRHAAPTDTPAQDVDSESYAVPKLVADWVLFAAGVALLVFCAFYIKDMTDWQDRFGGFVPAFLVMFVLMIIASKLLMPRVDKAIGWAKTAFTGQKG